MCQGRQIQGIRIDVFDVSVDIINKLTVGPIRK